MQVSHFIKKSAWVLAVICCVIIGLYPSIYFIIDRKFGLLASKPEALLASPGWNIGFYMHIIAGGLALLTGWMQFPTAFRNKHLKWHRRTGKGYVFSALLSAAAGMYIALSAAGGWISATGFFCLGAVWLYTTWIAYRLIKKGNITPHRNMMIYSYAACFAAVTLRLWLPLLSIVIADSITAYRLVAWLCWVPNLVVAYLLTKTPPGLSPVSAHSQTLN